MANADRFLDRTALLLCQLARRDTRPRIESSTLRKALNCRLDSRPSPLVALARLSVPHYWAVYYHDGRGPVFPRKKKVLVYYRSIEDDPRVTGTTSPERFKDTKALALPPDTFKRLVKAGKILVRTKSKASTVAHPFFSPLKRFQTKAAPAVNRVFSRFVLEDLRDAGLLTIRGRITVGLG